MPNADRPPVKMNAIAVRRIRGEANPIPRKWGSHDLWQAASHLGQSAEAFDLNFALTWQCAPRG